MKVGGVVLCGGRSSRMGQPKAWLPFGDELMLQRIVRVMREVVGPVVVVAAPGQDVPVLPAGVEIVRDEIGGKGPLAGLAAGLTALEGKADAAYLSSCDVPFLRPEFVRRVIELLQPNLPAPFSAREGGASPLSASGRGLGEGSPAICVPRVGGYHHPLAAVYRVGVLPHVRELLAAERLRPVFLFDTVPTRVVEPAELADVDPEFASLRNLNTPEDYEAAIREARLAETPEEPR
jgi:molybdopterin-guanine dinucleotide biosynthesis protein A